MILTEIRAKNLSLLSEKGFTVASSLPVNDTPPLLRSTDEILSRFLAMEAVFNWASGRDRPDTGMIEQLERWFTEDERAILHLEQKHAIEEFSYNIGWKLENMWPLAWVLGFNMQPDFDGTIIPDEVIDAMLGDFMARFSETKPRSVDEVVELEDLFYCAHNAAVSARLGGKTAPDGFHAVMNGGVIQERRHALTWSLTPGCDWEDTDLNT